MPYLSLYNIDGKLFHAIKPCFNLRISHNNNHWFTYCLPLRASLKAKVNSIHRKTTRSSASTELFT